MRLITDDALGIMATWAEAEGEPFEGKCAVGEVIRRRAVLKYNARTPTIASVLVTPYQFSFFNMDPGDRARLTKALQIDTTDPVVDECRRAWEQSETSDYSKGAVLYYNPAAVVTAPAWALVYPMVAQIGRHRFHKP